MRKVHGLQNANLSERTLSLIFLSIFISLSATRDGAGSVISDGNSPPQMTVLICDDTVIFDGDFSDRHNNLTIIFTCRYLPKSVKSIFQKRVLGSPNKRMIFFENRGLSDKAQCLL